MSKRPTRGPRRPNGNPRTMGNAQCLPLWSLVSYCMFIVISLCGGGEWKSGEFFERNERLFGRWKAGVTMRCCLFLRQFRFRSEAAASTSAIRTWMKRAPDWSRGWWRRTGWNRAWSSRESLFDLRKSNWPGKKPCVQSPARKEIVRAASMRGKHRKLLPLSCPVDACFENTFGFLSENKIIFKQIN